MNSCRWVMLTCCFFLSAKLICLDSNSLGKKLIAGETAKHPHVAVDWTRFRVPSNQDRKLLRNWILELQSRSMVVDRLAVDVSGEKYIGAKVDGSERLVARRFAFKWAIDHRKDRERLVFADQSLLGAPAKKMGQAYLIDSQALSYDQLRIRDLFHGATGKKVHPPSRTKSLNARFRLCGVFDPICATTGGVISIATGNAFERNKCQLHQKNLIGIYKQQDLTVAAFEYQPVPKLIFVRVASFRDDVPVQVDDFLSLGSDLTKVLELGDQKSDVSTGVVSIAALPSRAGKHVGAYPIGRDVRVKIDLKNSLGSPLNLRDVDPDCGCLAVVPENVT